MSRTPQIKPELRSCTVQTRSFDRSYASFALSLVLLAAQPAQCASTEQETMRRLAQLRAIPQTARRAAAPAQRADGRRLAVLPCASDEALPVLRRELAAELRKPKPAQLLLLDVASFFYLDGRR
jgi:hypothetical protein